MEQDRCKSEFDGNRCVKPSGHRGKHLSDVDVHEQIQFVQWTDAGAARAKQSLDAPIKAWSVTPIRA